MIETDPKYDRESVNKCKQWMAQNPKLVMLSAIIWACMAGFFVGYLMGMSVFK